MKIVYCLALCVLAHNITFGWCHQPDTLTARKFYDQGESYFKSEKYDSAGFYFKSALPAYEDAGQWMMVVKCYNQMGRTSFSLSKYNDATAMARLALSVNSGKIKNKNAALAITYNLLGILQEYKSNMDSAYFYYETALAIDKEIYGGTHSSVARDYLRIANVYRYKGDNEKVLSYHEVALKIFLKTLGKDNAEVADVYNGIALYYFNVDDSDKALDYINRAIAIYIKTNGENSRKVANCYNNIGVHYMHQNNPAAALTYYQKTLKIYEKIFNGIHPYITMFYRNVGNAYTEQKKYDEALRYYNRSIDMCHVIFGDKHPALSSAYDDVMKLYSKKGDYHQSLRYAQKSLMALVLNFSDSNAYRNPALANYLDANELLISLTNKAEVLMDLYTHEHRLEDLEACIATYSLAEGLIDIIRKSHTSQVDKIFFGKTTASIFAHAIDACITRSKLASGDVYLEKAFYFSEKSKAGTLADAQAELTAKNFGTVPEHLRDLERRLKEERSTCEAQLQQESMKDSMHTAAYGIAQDKLFKVNRRYDSLVHYFEKNYPQYHRLKYQNKITSVNEIQNRLDNKTALIEYFTGDQKGYIFVITRHIMQCFLIEDTEDIRKGITSLREILNPVDNKVKSAPVFARYVKESSRLYNKVMAATMPLLEGKDKLIVIPDGHLNYLPFDILLSDSTSDASKTSYRTLSYLLSRFRISYGYSATTLFNAVQQRSHYHHDLIAFAPQYDIQKISAKALAEAGNFRSRLTSLSWNQQEVHHISRYVNGEKLIGSDAAENTFKANANQYNIIHLAMHALVDDEHPMYSKLAFSLSDNVNEDGFLNAYELYNMELSAALVVLSACETGYGKLERGEGIMSLAHAFTYAGCPAIVMSHWLADDKATAHLMELFYKNLADGMPKDAALQKAKLAFIHDADDIRENPAFWAGFVVLGDTSPIVLNSFMHRYWIYFLAGILGFASVLIILRRRLDYFIFRSKS